MLGELRALLPYLRRYRWTYVIGSICIVGSIALKLLIPYLLGDSIDTLRELAEQADPSRLDARATSALILRSALTIVFAALAVAVVRTASRLLILGTSRRVAHDMRNVIFDRLLRLAPSFYVRNPIGQIMSRAVNDMQNVQGLMGPVIMYFAETGMLFALGITMMLGIHAQLTLVGLIPFPFFLVAARRIAVRIQEGSRAAQNSLGELSAKVDESLSGQLVIKTLALEDHDRGRFLERCRDYRRLNLEVTRHRAILIPMMMALTSLSTIIVLALGGPQVARGDMTLGALVSLILYMQMLAGPTRTLGFIISSLRRGAAALGRIRELTQSEVTLSDPTGGARLEAKANPIEVRVENLSVVYPPLADQPHLSGSLPELLGTASADTLAVRPTNGDRALLPRQAYEGERRVLDDISITIPAGHTLGIVGHVGSGKTTLVRAIARQLEVEPGRVFFDGVDVTTLDLASVRRAIGLVPQDVFLFSASLADNIALGNPDAGRDRIEQAIAAAQLDRDLPQLPDGLDTVVGERGINLSGGQRQRTALARVMLLEPRLLILDDTLSAVDTDTADAILAKLRPFSRQRTTIIVAHRLSVVQHADQIIVLEEGRIAEQGSHPQLMALEGRYAELYRQQERRQARAHELRDGFERNGADGDDRTDARGSGTVEGA